MFRIIAILLFIGLLACGGSDEESAIQLLLNEIYDDTRSGAHLILEYDKASESFKGTVENTTNKTLRNVRVEIHLSNGVELGPTTPTNLAPGEKINIVLDAKNQKFNTWNAHAEVG